MNSVFKPAFILMVGRAVGFAVNFLTPIVMVRIFSQAEFGTYKQIFLLHATFFGIAQIGMAEGLYYFLPIAPEKAGKYVLTSLLALSVSGLCALASLQFASIRIAEWLSNPALPQYITVLGLYLWFTLMSTPLEIVLVARQRYFRASTVYAASDIIRTALILAPALLGWGLSGVMWGAVASSIARLCATIVFTHRAFKSDLRLDLDVLRRQLAYAMPFALWVVAEMANTTLPQYLVAHNFDTATFAIFSVGCLQVPVIDFVLASAGSVMMVKIGVALREHRTDEVLLLWHETNRKLALIFFPIVALLALVARELITFLFTANYSPSAPLFAVWCIMILLAAVPIEGVLRTFADTRILFLFSLIKLLVVSGFSLWSLRTFGLMGIILVTILGTAMYKVLGLFRLKVRADIAFRELLPWTNLATILGCAAAATVPALIVKSLLKLPLGSLLATTSFAYLSSYLALSHCFGLVNVKDLMARTLRRWNYGSAHLAAAEAELQ